MLSEKGCIAIVDPFSAGGTGRSRANSVGSDDGFADVMPRLVRQISRQMSVERPDLGIGDVMSPARSTRQPSKEAVNSVVAVVDPYSTGCCVALEAFLRGYKVIALWTRDCSDELKAHRPHSCAELEYLAEVTEGAGAEETAARLKEACGPLKLVAVIVGGDSGVLCADTVSEHLGLRSNGTAVRQRRDKKVQQELVKAAGLRSVRQASGTQLSDVEDFLRTEPMPVVVKPVESAGSDGVKLCHTAEEAKAHFSLLMTAQRRVGGQGAAVLCQEFLKGKEYVVDHVSMDGVHKTVMIWVYDKRPANGSAFVYFGMLPVRSDSPEAKVLIPYVRGVLDALKITNGPTHGEVMMTVDGPCLVEMNCRAHGGDGTFVPMAKALTGGYSQVDAAVDAFLDPKVYLALPERPPAPFKAAGQEVTLVSFAEGRVTAMPGIDRIRDLASFVYLETGVDIGSQVERSVDLFTAVGSCILMHSDPEQLCKDVEAIRQLERSCELFEFEQPLGAPGGACEASEGKPHGKEIAQRPPSLCPLL